MTVPLPIQPFDLLSIIMIGLSIVFALLSVEHPNIVYAVLFLLLLNVVLGILFFLLKAPIVSFVQIAIYAGAMTFFFLITIILTRGGKW